MFKIEKNTLFYLVVISVVCFFAFFTHNTAIPADYMESRNLATAQEMVREGNYLIPSMNGELRLEKPPLPTWIAAGVEHIIPGQLAVQRAMSGLSATFMVFFLFFLVSYLTKNKNIGLVAALICASCYNVIMMGRNVTWDIYCHSFMLMAIFFLAKALMEDGRQWKNFLLSGVLMGLSFLSKGPVSFFALLLPFIIAFIWVYRPRIKNKVLPLLIAILIILAISFWWYGYIWLFHQDMLLSITEKEATSWIDHNVRPFYYYWQFPVEGGIWAVFWVTAIVYFFIQYRKEKMSKVYIFSMIWMISSLVFLSIVPEKKTRYLLPMLIPGSIVIAFYLFYMTKDKIVRWEKIVFKVNSGLIAVILLVLPVLMYFFFVKKEFISFSLYIIISVLFIVVGLYLLAGIYGNKMQVQKVFTSAILTMIIVEGLCMIPVGRTFVNEDRHSIRMLRDEPKVKNLPFYHNIDDFLRMEIVYEADKTIRPLDLMNDSAVYSKIPFVLVSVAPADSILKGKNVEIEYIDTFDNNWRKRDSKRYNKELVSHVAIIKAVNN